MRLEVKLKKNKKLTKQNKKREGNPFFNLI
jgi:hypothetical protein